MTWETVLLREAQRFAEDVSPERRKPRLSAFDLPLPTIQPGTLGDGNLAAKIARLSVPEARKLGISKTTLWYQQKRLKEGAPVRVCQKSTRKNCPSLRLKQIRMANRRARSLRSVGREVLLLCDFPSREVESTRTDAEESHVLH